MSVLVGVLGIGVLLSIVLVLLLCDDAEDQRKVALHLLSLHGEQYGLQLVERSDGILKRGSVYVILDQLEQEGLVVSHRVDAHDPVAGSRRRYRLTEQR